MAKLFQLQEYEAYWSQDHNQKLAQHVWGCEAGFLKYVLQRVRTTRAQTTHGLRAVPVRLYGDGADVFGPFVEIVEA